MAPSVWLAQEQMGGPRGHCTHTYTRPHVYQRVDTHGVEDSCTPAPTPGSIELVPRVVGLGGGRTGPTLALNLGQSLNQGNLFGFREGL